MSKMTVNGVNVDLSDTLDIRIDLDPDGHDMRSITVTVSGGELHVAGPGAALEMRFIDGGRMLLHGSECGIRVTTDPTGPLHTDGLGHLVSEPCIVIRGGPDPMGGEDGHKLEQSRMTL